MRHFALQGGIAEEEGKTSQIPSAPETFDGVTKFRLEKQDEGRFTLFPIAISTPYTCALSEMQPGQPGGGFILTILRPE